MPVSEGIAVGLQLGTQPPLGAVTGVARYARLIGLRSLMTIDHFQNIFPSSIWDEQFSWLAARRATPHEHLDYQALLGYLAARTRLRLGVGVTEPIRRHPVLIAQTMLTVAQMSRKAPILGIGAGERMNIDPYGLDYDHPISRLDEALQIIRRCFAESGPISFAGRHFTLDNALMDLKAPPGRTPAIWVAGHGPKMLELTATYGDGWYPTMITSPQEYATKLAIIRAAAIRHGRGPAAITPALHRFVVVARTDHEVQALLRHRSMRMLGLAAPADLWRELGAHHPFGEDFRGYVDFIPQRYDRPTLDAALAAVPLELIEHGPLLWGTPGQIIDKLREYVDAGLRHVVLAPVSGLVSPKAALYAFAALRPIARALARTRRDRASTHTRRPVTTAPDHDPAVGDGPAPVVAR